MLAAHLTLAQFVGYGERAPATWSALVLLALLNGGCQAATQGSSSTPPAKPGYFGAERSHATYLAAVRFLLHVGGYSRFLGAKAR
jgi:hypothetical protein